MHLSSSCCRKGITYTFLSRHCAAKSSRRFSYSLILEKQSPFFGRLQNKKNRGFGRYPFEILRITWKKWNKEHQTLIFQFFITKSSIFMVFVLFFHVVCKISNFSMWTAKHLGQASCTELTLKRKLSSTSTKSHVNFVRSGKSLQVIYAFKWKFFGFKQTNEISFKSIGLVRQFYIVLLTVICQNHSF